MPQPGAYPEPAEVSGLSGPCGWGERSSSFPPSLRSGSGQAGSGGHRGWGGDGTRHAADGRSLPGSLPPPPPPQSPPHRPRPPGSRPPCRRWLPPAATRRRRCGKRRSRWSLAAPAPRPRKRGTPGEGPPTVPPQASGGPRLPRGGRRLLRGYFPFGGWARRRVNGAF